MTLGLNEVTGLAATIVCAWGVVGLAPHLLRPERRAAFWLSITIVLLLAQGAGRTLYWDGMATMLGDDRTAALRDALGGVGINWLWNLILLGAGYSLLRLLHLLIPDDDRPDWPLWKAPIYPAKVSFAALVEYLRSLWSDRRKRIGKD